MEITTETQFPLPPGAEVSLKCSAGFTLTGDMTVTCKEGTTFLFESAPVCQLGLHQAVDMSYLIVQKFAFHKHAMKHLH